MPDFMEELAEMELAEMKELLAALEHEITFTPTDISLDELNTIERLS